MAVIHGGEAPRGSVNSAIACRDMSLFSKIASFARSRQGRQLASQASRYARSPQGRAQIDKVRRQLTARGRKPKR